MIQTIAVFCASADGADPCYCAAAAELGAALGNRNIRMVYGGAAIGLMRAVADATLAKGGCVVGVIPEVLVAMEVAYCGCTELHVVDTMHTRKAKMAELADAFLVLPGGFGTLEEVFEVLAWQTLKLHTKPILLLNTNGFYDKLLEFLDHAVEQGMLKRKNREIVLVADTVDEALRLLVPEETIS
ncbi:MAG: TIGR00730 family Rossman fold protein [Granulicella sp.]